MNDAENCKRFNNLLKNILKNFKSNDERFEDVNREKLRAINQCKFIIINDFYKFYFLINKNLNVIVIARLNVIHVKFIII